MDIWGVRMSENKNLRSLKQAPRSLLWRLYQLLSAFFGIMTLLSSAGFLIFIIYICLSEIEPAATPREIQAIDSFNLPGAVELLHSLREEDFHGKPSIWYVFKITPEAAEAAPDIIPAWLREHYRRVTTVSTSGSYCIIPSGGPKWWNPRDYSDVKACCASTRSANYWVFWSRREGLLFFHEFRI